ncbi:MAG: hypothetical protein AM1032_000404 [Mycoplasmataceae bacterium]|nr:MAG: hypothetical protein AM1032_000404 [Mycoplasmataceae bacterium]
MLKQCSECEELYSSLKQGLCQDCYENNHY